MTKQIVQKTTSKGKMIREILMGNGGRRFSVTFKKANGEMRTLTGSYGQCQGQDGENTCAHLEKYVTIYLPEKDPRTGLQARRNVNVETVTQIKTNKTTLNFE